MNEFPRLRNLDAIPVKNGDETLVTIYDPTRYSETSMSVSLPAFYLISLMDGNLNANGLREKFAAHFKQQVSLEEVAYIIKKLDEAYMLDNDRFADMVAVLKSRFLTLPERPAFFAGDSYPAEPVKLCEQLDKFTSNNSKQFGKNINAILVPHIDFRVGADMMGAGWREIKNSTADLFIILGTGHSLSEDFFSCISKDFATPVGSMRVDRKFLAELEKNFGEKVETQADAHRMEHSIEFQSLFFAHLFGKKKEATAVPILLSFPENIWSMGHPVFNGERVDRFITALKKTIQATRRKTVFVASVDFSHVGARFGDHAPLSDDALRRIENDDIEIINAIKNIDIDTFTKKILQTNSSNRVCGFPAIYTLLKVCNATKGELIEYRQNIEGEKDSMVSFATMALMSD